MNYNLFSITLSNWTTLKHFKVLLRKNKHVKRYYLHTRKCGKKTGDIGGQKHRTDAASCERHRCGKIIGNIGGQRRQGILGQYI